MVESITQQTLIEALQIRKSDLVIPYAGGTDLMVRRRSWAGVPKFEYPALFIGTIPELTRVYRDGQTLVIGAAVKLADLIENPDTPLILKKAISQMASPAIRNIGTIGGNICNASPAADTLPSLYALGATVVLQSISGERELPIVDFVVGPGQTALRVDELLTAIKIPFEHYDVVYYKKVGTRKADALSKVSFAGLAKIEDSIVRDFRLSIGAVAPRVVWSSEAAEKLIGEKVTQIPDLFEEIKDIYRNEIQPIDDQRSNAKYRRMVALRLMEDFLKKLAGYEEINNTQNQ